MIRHLKIKNFRSLENFEIDFQKQFHAIIGRNNSGKSNLIEAINFISKLAKRLELFNIIDSMGGFNQILYFGADEKRISFEVEIESKNDIFLYEFEFSDKTILRERLLLNNNPQLEIINKEKGKVFDYIENTFKEFSFYPNNLAINQLWDKERYKSIRKFSKILNKFKIYKFIPPMMRETTQARKEFDAEMYGQKIVQVLHSILSTDYRTYQEIVEIMKTIFDEIDEIHSTIDERGLTNIEILEKGFEKPFNINQISDGILKFLGILSVIKLEKKYSLFCFEEPELYLHPYLLDKLIDLLKELNTQVLITTHSPQILDILDPNDLIIIIKRKGHSFCQKLPTKPEILKKLKDDGFLLGELWTMGEFDNA